MHDMACEFRASKDAQKQLARTSLKGILIQNITFREVYFEHLWTNDQLFFFTSRVLFRVLYAWKLGMRLIHECLQYLKNSTTNTCLSKHKG